jgi:hypothetical protein
MLGLLVTLVTWDVSFSPPSFGLDPSWWAAMYMAAHRGLQFGTQIVFTYGPLAFLREAWLWYGNLAVIGFLYGVALQIGLAVSAVWALRRTLSAPFAAALASATLLATPSRDVPLALAAIWCLVALSPEPPRLIRWLVGVGGGLLGAIEVLVELRSGPVIWGMCLITLLAISEWRRFTAIFVGVSVFAFGVLWFAAGQSTGNLPDFASTAAQIVSGYSEAMGILVLGTVELIAIVAIGIGLVTTAARAAPERRGRIASALVVGLLMFALYKEAVVRAESHHATIFFSTAAVLSVGIAFGRRRFAALALVLGLAIVAYTELPSDSQVDLNPASHAKMAVDEVRLLLNPAERSRIAFYFSIRMAEHYQIDPATLALLRGHTVQIEPWETAVAWLYGLRWDPLPVFQGYSAYTALLDRLNASALRSPAGPERILRENTMLVDHQAPAIDSRLQAWDPPGTALAMLCNYVTLRTTPRWQVLGKVADRCGRPQLIATVDTSYGRLIGIPADRPGGILYASVHGAAVSGVLERLRTSLFRAKFRYAVVNGTSVYRVVPGTAEDGLLMDAPADLDYPAPFRLSPQARTIKFTGPSGPLRLDLEWMPVRGGTAGPGSGLSRSSTLR